MAIYERNERNSGEKRRRRIVCSSKSAGSGYTFARKGDVPAGVYKATLDCIAESKTSKGAEAIDVYYTLENGEKSHKILQRVADGYYFERFSEQLMDAGVKKGTYLDEVKDHRVTVEVRYNYDDFAQITVLPSRSVATRMSLLLEEEEDDDLLDEED